jgi:hypothetical protein
VLSAGSPIRTFSLGGGPVLDAALDGPRLVALQADRLTVLALRTGHRLAAWPLHLGFGSNPTLEDAQGDLAVYAVGAAIHVVGLSTGRDMVIDTPNATEPVFAQLVPSGLFYAYNEAYAKRPGLLVFVAKPKLERAITSGAAPR